MHKITAFALFGAFLGAQAATAQTMTLTSPDIAPGARIADEQVFKGFGCAGGNISPALSWSGAPEDTKSSRSRSTIPTRRPAVDSGTGSSSISRLT
jgi:phosphatidylethanolamine-binding protein (PEBP) family uncharacterized protein